MTTQSILEKIRHLMEKTVERGCTEGEAQAAAELVQRLLTKHNLSVVDLEKRGAKKANVGKLEHDLGKAAFKWKLLLADVMAGHYYCYSMTDWTAKRVFFVGRRENTEALTMLYQWVIDQIRRIAAEDRKAHIDKTGEHIDPLRWQVNFGEGAAYRLGQRLAELKRKQGEETQALVLHHLTEISDWMEAQGHWRRPDGQETQADRKRREAHEHRMRVHDERMQNDPEYRRVFEQRLKDAQEREAAEEKAEEKKERQRARRRRGRVWREETEAQRARRLQQETAHEAGTKGADRVNLEPFIEGQAPKAKAVR